MQNPWPHNPVVVMVDGEVQELGMLDWFQGSLWVGVGYGVTHYVTLLLDK